MPQNFEQDADYVEIMHSSDPNDTPMGHADFFINGGKEQLGCSVYVQNECSSNRALELYIESLDVSDFYANQCPDPTLIDVNSCLGKEAKMGGVEMTAEYKGVFYLRTNRTPPFSLTVKENT